VRTVGPGLGAALFTVFVKGAGFSFMCNALCAKKGRIGIGQWEKRMKGKKTRTLEQAQECGTQSSKALKGWRTWQPA
jgi:hypothetical protein